MIRSANPADTPVICELIRALADYERLADQVRLDERQVHEHLFGPRPVAEVILAEEEGQVVGFALYFANFSTFLGRPGTYLEDLFVRPEFRGRGHGQALFREVARRAVQRGSGRMEWAVLEWNEPAIRFYESLGARPQTDWRLWRLTEEALARFET